MKVLLSAISFLFSSNLFCQSKTYVQETIHIIIWDSSKSVSQYQVEDSIIENALIGKWKDQNSILHFRKKEKVAVEFLEDGKVISGKWSITKGILKLKFKDYTETYESNCKILEFSPTRFKFQDSNSAIWIANKLPD